MDRNDYRRMTDTELDRELRMIQDRKKRTEAPETADTDDAALAEITAVIEERRAPEGVVNVEQITIGGHQITMYERRDRTRRDGWYYSIGPHPARGPFPSKSQAATDRDNRLAKLAGKRK